MPASATVRVNIGQQMLQRETILSAFAALLMAFCVPAGATELPEAFSRPWCTYRTAHFELLTDLPRRQALARAEALGRFRTLFMALFQQTDGDSPPMGRLSLRQQRLGALGSAEGSPEERTHAGVPVRMLVFRRAQHFTEVTGTADFAGITVPSLRAYQLLIGPAQPSPLTDTGGHEYAHYLMRNRTELHYPLWYEEGLASYLSAADLERNPVPLGHLDPRVRWGKARSSDLSLEEVVLADSVVDWPPRRLTAFYEKAWLLVHFIRLGHHLDYPDFRPALVRYLEQPERGFATAFGLSPYAMGELVKDYLRHPRLRIEFVQLPSSAEEAVQAPARRCLDEAEGRLELARSIVHQNPQLAAQALERHPGGEADADWLTVQSEALSAVDYERAMAVVERALELDPSHAAAMAQLAHLKVHRCPLSSHPDCMRNWAEAATLYRQAQEGDPRRYDVAYGLGVAYLHTGRAEQALDHLRLAYAQMPWAAEANFYLGEAYRMLGDERAAGHLRKAHSWAGDSAWRARAAAALTRLQEVSFENH